MARMLFMHYGIHSDPGRLKTMILQQLRPYILVRKPSDLEVEEAVDNLIDFALKVDLGLVVSRFDIRIEMEDPETGLQSGFGFTENSRYMVLDTLYDRD